MTDLLKNTEGKCYESRYDEIYAKIYEKCLAEGYSDSYAEVYAKEYAEEYILGGRNATHEIAKKLKDFGIDIKLIIAATELDQKTIESL
ncbi:MAG TPA: hypothetical protein DCS67_10300 [Clostridiales bacterium UBA8960]|jgi:hypothetical protein|nr:hypothetical protein [Clostridiales bacterium UBA8960]